MKKITLLLSLLFGALMVANAEWVVDDQSIEVATTKVFSTSSGFSTQSYGPGPDSDHKSVYKKSVDVGDYAGVDNVTLASGFNYRFTFYMKKGNSGATVKVYLKDGSLNVSEEIDLPYGGGTSNGDAFKFTSDVIAGDDATHNLRAVVSGIGSGDEKWRTAYFLLEKEEAAGGAPKPTIENLAPATKTSHELGASFDISATVTITEGTIDAVKVAYGQSANALNDTLVCGAPTGNVYSVSYDFSELDTVFFQMVAFGSNGETKTSSVLELYGVCAAVAAPVATAASDVAETSFTANWDVSADATGYLLDVWKESAATVVSNDLFFSEYAEGSTGDEKYFEIYNGTADTVFLKDYAHPNVSNAPASVGEYEYWNTFKDGAFIAPGEVYIVVHSGASEGLKAKADELNGYLTNGDDGRALVKNDGIWNDADNDGKVDAGEMTGFTVLDWLGDFQGDPGSGWEVAGVAKATENHVLVRKSSVSDGNTDWDAARGSNATDSEWIVKDDADYSDMAMHTMDGAASIGYILQGEDVGDVTSKELTGLTTNTEYHYAVSAYNAYGCESDLSNIMNAKPSSATSVNELTVDAKVFAADHNIIVRANEQVAVTIYEITGRQVAQRVVEGEARIAVKGGIYLVKANDTVVKVVVK